MPAPSEAHTEAYNRCEVIGSPNYMAVEMLRNQPYDAPLVDWWSLGVILFEMLVGGPPFYGSVESEVFQNVIDYQTLLGDLAEVLEIADPVSAAVSKAAWSLVTSILREPDERSGFQEIMNSEFMNRCEMPTSGEKWRTFRETASPPFKPQLLGPFDCSYFPGAETVATNSVALGNWRPEMGMSIPQSPMLGTSDSFDGHSYLPRDPTQPPPLPLTHTHGVSSNNSRSSLSNSNSLSRTSSLGVPWCGDDGHDDDSHALMASFNRPVQQNRWSGSYSSAIFSSMSDESQHLYNRHSASSNDSMLYAVSSESDMKRAHRRSKMDCRTFSLSSCSIDAPVLQQADMELLGSNANYSQRALRVRRRHSLQRGSFAGESPSLRYSASELSVRGHSPRSLSSSSRSPLASPRRRDSLRVDNQSRAEEIVMQMLPPRETTAQDFEYIDNLFVEFDTRYGIAAHDLFACLLRRFISSPRNPKGIRTRVCVVIDHWRTCRP
eukprot:TRINITY_DN9193_c0_g1_i1.p1 TRINITY_DN9193_c0_g1~~TRINITY_DN9193_c0_g1_i1.p1  ORF type:complete len:528 (+),score=66.05 TRINITY_DN9193_c0_g1_i1:108-1586(+)